MHATLTSSWWLGHALGKDYSNAFIAMMHQMNENSSEQSACVAEEAW